MTDTPQEHSGSCYCGAVTVTVTGAPIVSGYCHCNSCRKFHGAPVMAFSAWSSDNVSHSGAVRATDKVAHLARTTCEACGGKVMGVLPEAGLTVVFPAVLDGGDLPFEPQFHQFYAERALDVADGLPKFADVPSDFGGSGEMVEEPPKTGVRG